MSYFTNYPSLNSETLSIGQNGSVNLNLVVDDFTFSGDINDFRVVGTAATQNNSLYVQGTGNNFTYDPFEGLSGIATGGVLINRPGLNFFLDGDFNYNIGVATAGFKNVSGVGYTGNLLLNSRVSSGSTNPVRLTTAPNVTVNFPTIVEQQPVTKWTIQEQSVYNNTSSDVQMNQQISHDPYGLTEFNNIFYNYTGRPLSLFVSWQFPFCGLYQQYDTSNIQLNVSVSPIVSWLAHYRAATQTQIRTGIRSTSSTSQLSSPSYAYGDSTSHAHGTFINMQPGDGIKWQWFSYNGAGFTNSTITIGTLDISLQGTARDKTFPSRTNIGVNGSCGHICITRLN